MFGNGLRLQTGPQMGFLTAAQYKGAGEEATIKSSLKDTEFSWSFGASYLSRIGLGIDARYNLGLTDISKTSADIKNRVWQAGLFYQLH